MKTYPYRWAALAGATLLFAGAAPCAGSTPAAPPTPTDTAPLEHRLEAAHERLEAAAREVAELAAALVPSEVRDLELHIGHPRPMLGVQLGEARAGGGVRINSVSPGGPAAAAGLKAGDVIVRINGQAATGAAEVAAQVRALKPKEEAKLDVDRGGKVEQVAVAPRILDARVMRLDGDGFNLHWPDFAGGMPMLGGGPAFLQGRRWGGLELAPLSTELGRYFGADKGLLVIRAPPDGSLKLRDGDVITSIDGREPDGVAHALRILRSYEPGERVTLAILRDRKTQKLELTMPEGGGHPMAPLAPTPPHGAAPPAPPAHPG